MIIKYNPNAWHKTHKPNTLAKWHLYNAGSGVKFAFTYIVTKANIDENELLEYLYSVEKYTRNSLKIKYVGTI
jgi:hypothetical protein